jgi:hypothetical protein
MIKQPPLGLLPRHFWLIQRTDECVKAIERFHEQSNWEQYIIKTKELAEELLYACTEWEKYYKNPETKECKRNYEINKT